MSNIAMDEVKRIADLARLAVTEEDTKMFKEHLDAITTYAEKLNEEIGRAHV